MSYNATNSVSVRLDNLSLVGAVIDAGLKAGANQLDGVQFELRNDLPQRELALRQAVNEAQQKARAMAEALRVNLGEVLEVTEGNPQQSRPVYARAAPSSLAAQAAPTPVAAGEIEVDAEVTIRYRISPKP